MLAQSTLPRNRAVLPSLVCAALLAVAVLPMSRWITPASTISVQPQTSAISAHLPISFVPNRGQTASDVRFTARASTGTIEFRDSGLSLRIPGSEAEGAPSLLDMEFVNSSASVRIEQGTLLPGTMSYYAGSDPEKWRAGLPTYSSITYSSLYPGIDLEYAGDRSNLKGTYKVAPNADPARIRWSYPGASKLSIATNGDLLIAQHPAPRKDNPAPTELTELAPVAWQEINGQKQPVAASYAIDQNTVGFRLGEYNHDYPLVIDPVLTYSTYFGGFARDTGVGIGLDAQGNLYVGGTSFSTDLQYGNLMIAKLSPDGQSILYQVDFGGSRSESATAIVATPGGELYISGTTNSSDYPILNPLQPAFRPVVLTKFDTNGFMLYSTHFGGLAVDSSLDLALDTQDNLYIAGVTDSDDFPLVNPIQSTLGGLSDGYLAKLNSSGTSIIYATYLGGMYNEEIDRVFVDPGGNAYITGGTGSPNFPTTPNTYQPSFVGDNDAFVAKISASGSDLSWSTFLSGGSDSGFGIAADDQGYVFVTGYAGTQSFPTTPGSFQPYFHGTGDAFVAKLTPNAGAIVYSTLLGGSGVFPHGEDYGVDLVVDSQGYAYVTGVTSSEDFPTVNAVQDQYGGLHDAFVAKFTPDGSDAVYSTYLGGTYVLQGGSGDDEGEGIVLDAQGNVVVGGTARSGDFPLANPVMSEIQGTADYFISRIADTNPSATPTPGISVTPQASPTAGTPGPTATGQPSVVSSATPAASATAAPTASPTACAIRFVDVPANSTFQSYITCLACQGIVSGYACGGPGEPCPGPYFRPGSTITRGQLAKIVAQAAAFDNDPGPQIYEDVPPGSTFYTWVNVLSAYNIMQGYPCGSSGEACGPANLPYFRPGLNATRGQIAKIVSNALGYSNEPTAQSFEDVPNTSTFYLWVERLAGRGIISGYPCGTGMEPCSPGNRPYFRPSGNVTRGQASKIISVAFFPGCSSR